MKRFRALDGIIEIMMWQSASIKIGSSFGRASQMNDSSKKVISKGQVHIRMKFIPCPKDANATRGEMQPQ
jgi:hypothetical protein